MPWAMRRRQEWLGWVAGIVLAGWLSPWWLGIVFADQNLQLAYAAIGVLLAAPAVCEGRLSPLRGAALAFASFLVLMGMDSARIWVNTGGQLRYVASFRMFTFGAAASLAGAAVASRLRARQWVWAILIGAYMAIQWMPDPWRWAFLESLQPGAPKGVFGGAVAGLAGVYLIFSSFSTRPSRM